MMKLSLLIQKNPLLSLVLVALISGILWRLELEYHGWGGLIWLSYFHLAIPIGFVLFLYWANQFVELSWLRRIVFNVVSLVFATVLYWCLAISLRYTFAPGPLAFLRDMESSWWELLLHRYSILILLPIIPIGSFLIVKIFRKDLGFKNLILCTIGLIVSIPISILLLILVNHIGSHDFIHALKSGFAIPFLVFSMGMLVVKV